MNLKPNSDSLSVLQKMGLEGSKASLRDYHPIDELIKELDSLRETDVSYCPSTVYQVPGLRIISAKQPERHSISIDIQRFPKAIFTYENRMYPQGKLEVVRYEILLRTAAGLVNIKRIYSADYYISLVVNHTLAFPKDIKDEFSRYAGNELQSMLNADFSRLEKSLQRLDHFQIAVCE